MVEMDIWSRNSAEKFRIMFKAFVRKDWGEGGQQKKDRRKNNEWMMKKRCDNVK